jgi:hypothetical protein
MTWSKVNLVILPIAYWFLFLVGLTSIAPAAEIQMQVQAVPPPHREALDDRRRRANRFG